MVNYIRSLTGALNANAKGGKITRYWMPDRPHLHLKVLPTGKKVWVFQYREVAPNKLYAERRVRKVRLPADRRHFINSDEHWQSVRETARDWADLLEAGIDPHEAQLASMIASAPIPSMPLTAKPERTFERLTRLYLRSRKKLSVSSVKRNERLANRRIFDQPLGNKVLSEVTAGDLRAAVHAEYRHSPDSATVLATLISQITRYGFTREVLDFTVEGKSLIPVDDDAKTRQAKIEQEEETGARHLVDFEIVAIWAADAAYPAKQWWQMMVLTGMRRSEAATIRWDDIVDGDRIHVPAERAKSGRAYNIPLTPQMREVLDECGYTDDAGEFHRFGEFLFSSPKNGKAIGGFTYWSKKLLKAAGIEGVSAHSCRKTSTTIMQRVGIAPPVIERAHNRVDGSVARAIQKAYHRHDYAEEMVEAFAKSNAEIARLVRGEEKVIEMKKGAAA